MLFGEKRWSPVPLPGPTLNCRNCTRMDLQSQGPMTGKRAEMAGLPFLDGASGIWLE
jgi:hypothetical protein